MSTETITPTIDQLNLAKGSVISVELVELMTDKEYGTSAYDLALMGLIGAIEQHLRRQGFIVTVRSVKGAVHILNDDEAAAYNHHQSELAVCKLSRAYRRNRAVVSQNLETFDRKIHTRNLDLQSRMLTEVRRVRREFSADEHERTTPGLPK